MSSNKHFVVGARYNVNVSHDFCKTIHRVPFIMVGEKKTPRRHTLEWKRESDGKRFYGSVTSTMHSSTCTFSGIDAWCTTADMETNNDNV